MTMDPGQQLLAHGRSLRGLAKALVGASDSDDLLQEGYAAALSAPGDRARSRSWLAEVMRRVAGKRRRREAVERAHRAQLEAESGEPATADQAALRELVARLNAELLALTEPYRGTLLARFYEALTPAAIARRDGVPTATVKSRLQRGLQMLRERMDATDVDGSDWRKGIVIAFGFERTAAASGGGAALITGVVLMNVWTKMATVVATLGLLMWAGLGVGWWGAPEGGKPPTMAGVAPAGAKLTAAVEQVDPLVPADRTDAASGQLLAPVDAVIEVRGRCLDEAAMPLAGVVVRVTHRDPWRFEEHVLAEQVTGVDGSFRVAVEEPPSQRLRLDCASPGRITIGAQRGDLSAGDEWNLGDLPMRAGCRVSGVLLDDRGAPVAAAVIPIELDLEQVPTPLFATATSDAAGAFTLDLLAGDYRLAVPNELVLAGERLTVAVGERQRAIIIRVASGLPQLRGIVVDDRGVAVPDAEVIAMELSTGWHSAGRTGADGRFRIQRTTRAPVGEIDLTAKAPGFDNVRAEGPVEWGGAPARIELVRSATLEVQVVQGGTARPVEGFGVRLGVAWSPPSPEANKGRFGGAVSRTAAFAAPRMVGLHDGGRLLVTDLHRDDYSLQVMPTDPGLAPSRVVPVSLGDAAHTTVRVEVWPRATRELEVVTMTGHPVAGTAIELCEVLSGEVSTQSTVVPIEKVLQYLVPDLAELLQASTTDESGRCRLSGPARRGLALRILGPGCVPEVVPDVRLDVAEPLRVVVDPGAELHVRAEPHVVLADLTALAAFGRGLSPAEAPPVVGIRLQSLDGTVTVPGDDLAPVPFDGAGEAALRGAPPGTWQVRMEWEVAKRREHMDLQTVTLVSGERRQLTADLASLRPVTLRGAVHLNGRPFGNEHVWLQAERRYRVRTDSGGHFEFRGLPGDYVLEAAVVGGKSKLRHPETVTLRPGDVRTAEFALSTSAVTLRFVDGAGAPVESVHEVRLMRGPMDWVATLPDTDADGLATLPMVGVGTFLLWAAPRRFDQWTEREAWVKEHPDRADEASRDLDLGRVVVQEGRDSVQTVVLPRDYFR